MEEKSLTARSSYDDNLDKKYDHEVATMQFVPSLDFYVLYKSLFKKLINRDKVWEKS